VIARAKALAAALVDIEIVEGLFVCGLDGLLVSDPAGALGVETLQLLKRPIGQSSFGPQSWWAAACVSHSVPSLCQAYGEVFESEVVDAAKLGRGLVHSISPSRIAWATAAARSLTPSFA
jgi:hypothetical protein